MTKRMFGCVAVAVLALSCNGTEVPPIGCPVQSLIWAASYQPKGTSSCPRKAGEQLGIRKFSGSTLDETLSIKPTGIADLEDRAPSGTPYSTGPVPKAAGADGFCTMGDMSVVEKHAPADPAQGLPAADVVYRFSNVKILARPDAPGTQLLADLELTQNGCTAQYEVWGVWPGDISCAHEAGQPDDNLCATAGTLNKDFATKCDPDLLLCVPAQRPPSFKAGK